VTVAESVCDDLIALARGVAGVDAGGIGDLAAAVALEELSALAKELASTLVVDAVRSRRTSWPTVARVFGITRQGAMKRFQR